MKRFILLILIVSGLSISAIGQDFTTTRLAFTRSYEAENDGKYDDAILELTKIYDEHSYEINLRLGWLSYLAGSYTESLEYYQKAIDLKPYAIEPRFGYILPLNALGNMTQVEDQYKKILSIDPMNTRANYWLGMIYYNREDYPNALKYFDLVINLYPFDFDSTIMCAWTNFKMQNLREAKAFFQQALLIRPGDQVALEGLGKIQ